MYKIKEAFAEYTGGGIWLFYGKLEDDSYFLTDDHGWTLILDADPSDLEESTFPEWQDEHLIEELRYEKGERLSFLMHLLEWISEHPQNSGGMTEVELDAYKTSFILNN